MIDFRLLKQPTPAAIRRARIRAGHTLAQAAELVGLSGPSRFSEYESGAVNMDAARWTLYMLATGQHSAFTIRRRSAA